MSEAALKALEAQVQAEIAYLDLTAASWVRPRSVNGQDVHDVVVVGAGLSGLGIGYGLLREQVRNIVLIDRAAPGHEGPWLSYARMPTLRTAKQLIGPDLGTPSVSFPAWYAARHGQAAWDALALSSTVDFVDYLRWFRRVTGVPVRNGVSLLDVQPHQDVLALAIDNNGQRETWYTRKLVLATGLDSSGPLLPAMVTNHIPPALRAHSSDAIDFTALRGKRVAVLGAGASAFDNAAVALEHGAAEVHLFARRESIEQPAIRTPLENAGLYRHYPDLDDDQRWRIMRRLARHSTPPPPYSVERCTRHAAFRLSTGCRWEAVRELDGVIHIDSTLGPVQADFLILATGFSIDVTRRLELAGLVHDIARWEDVYDAPPDDRPDLVAALAQSPYLGASFEYTAKPGHDAPWLHDIHDFGIAGLLSMGRISQGIPGMKFGPARLVQGLTRSLFLADADWHEANLIAADTAALAGAPDPGSVI